MSTCDAIVIGVTFVAMLLLASRRAYTDVLADLAQAMRGGAVDILLPGWLLPALHAGALVGGSAAGRWRSFRSRTAELLRCFTGGAAMAWGAS